jgi:hypothetical protein
MASVKGAPEPSQTEYYDEEYESETDKGSVAVKSKVGGGPASKRSKMTALTKKVKPPAQSEGESSD